MPGKDRNNPPWWDFVAYRRQYVSDLAWFGFAFLAVGLATLSEASGWIKVLPACVAIAGLAMIAAAIRRRVRSWTQDSARQAFARHGPDSVSNDLDNGRASAADG